jgi:hypothetical protein
MRIIILLLSYELSHGVGQIQWMHVFQEANNVVDALAKHGLNLDLHLNVFLCHY